MSEPDDLHTLLEKLHERLQQSPAQARSERALIGEVLQDLQRLRESPPDAAAPHPAALAERIVRLEATHPDLVVIVRQIIDTLARAGV